MAGLSFDLDFSIPARYFMGLGGVSRQHFCCGVKFGVHAACAERSKASDGPLGLPLALRAFSFVPETDSAGLRRSAVSPNSLSGAAIPQLGARRCKGPLH